LPGRSQHQPTYSVIAAAAETNPLDSPALSRLIDFPPGLYDKSSYLSSTFFFFFFFFFLLLPVRRHITPFLSLPFAWLRSIGFGNSETEKPPVTQFLAPAPSPNRQPRQRHHDITTAPVKYRKPHTEATPPFQIVGFFFRPSSLFTHRLME
jgi:hypothetical protein